MSPQLQSAGEFLATMRERYPAIPKSAFLLFWEFLRVATACGYTVGVTLKKDSRQTH